MNTQLARQDIAAHPFLIAAQGGSPSYQWATLALRGKLESAVGERHGRELHADLLRSGHQRLARVLERDIEQGGGELELGQRLVELQGGRTELASVVTACALHTLECELTRMLGIRTLHTRLGSYYAVKLVLTMLIPCSSEQVRVPGCDVELQRWCSFRDRVELHHARACMRFPALLGRDPALRELFWRGAEQTLAAFERCFDTLAELRRAELREPARTHNASRTSA